MKRCARGAIIGHTELAIFEQALTEAIDSLRFLIDATRRPNRAFHDDEYRKQMQDLVSKRSSFCKAREGVHRIRAAHRRESNL